MIESNLENAVVGIFDCVALRGYEEFPEGGEEYGDEVSHKFLYEMLSCLRGMNLTDDQVKVFNDRLLAFEEEGYEEGEEGDEGFAS